MIFVLLISIPGLAVMLWITISLYLRGKRDKGHRDYSNIRVSVIIPARNEAARIKSALQGIAAQDYPADLTEIIVVDDASTDSTANIIQEFIISNPDKNIKLISRSSAGKKEAVEEAVKTSSGELIITTDADCSHPSSWINSIVSVYSGKKPSMITGPVAFSDQGSLFSDLLFLEFAGLMGATAGSAFGGYPLMCNGANLTFTKKSFTEAGGFSDNRNYASGDDQFLMMKLIRISGTRSVVFNFDDSAIVTTAPPLSFRDFLRQRLRWVSKNKGYKDRFITGVAVFTWLINAFLVAGIFFPQIRTEYLIVAGSKFLLDLAVTVRMCFFFRRYRPLVLFPAAFVLNAIYVFLIGIAGMFISYEWKGIPRK